MNEETKNPIMEYATQKYASEAPVTTPEAEIVPESVTNIAEEAPVSTEIVEPNTTTEPVVPESVVETPAVDYSKFLTDESEGLFTDIESFKAAIPKVKEYDTLLASKTELEEKLKVDPFANDFVKTMNEMIKAGKTADEIENFTKISRLDLDQISAVDAKVMVLVKNGYSEAVARQKVARDFPIDDFDEGSTDRTILEEELRISSLEDRRILKEFKKDLTTVDNSAQEQQEQARLASIAHAETHKQTVKQVIPKISEAIVGLGERNLNGKEGDEAIKLGFNYTPDYKAELPSKLEAFFLDGQMEVNDDNIALAQKYIRADYLEKNFDTIAQSIFKHAESITEERMVNKYENLSGLPPEPTNIVVDNTQTEYKEFLQKMVKSR